MITSFFIQLLLLVVKGLLYPLTLLPDIVANPNVVLALTNIHTWLSDVNVIIPVSTLLAVLGLMLGFETAKLIYQLIYWVIKKIPTIS